jgi:3-oxoadipate enol-lactonase
VERAAGSPSPGSLPTPSNSGMPPPRPTGHVEAFVDVPGGRLFVVADGEGPPIVLVHSAIVDLRSWDAVVPNLAAAGYRVIRYDLRGYGRSTTEDVEFSQQADLLAVIEARDIQRCAIVGNSRGAMIALDTVLDAPERFVGFVWVGGGIGGFESSDGSTPAEMALFEEYDAAEQRGDVEAMADLEVRIWVDGVGQPPTRVAAEIREAVRDMDRPLLAPGRVFGRPIPLDPPANERLGELRIPILVTVGGLDTSGTLASARRLAEGTGRARLVTLRDVAHLVPMETPQRLAELIVQLLSGLPRWR